MFSPELRWRYLVRVVRKVIVEDMRTPVVAELLG
jgi:hypothetical protein